MDIVADESVDFSLVNSLRLAGYDIAAIIETTPGMNDPQVLNFANENKALLITEDKDFGELTFRLRLNHCGILLIRLSNLPRNERIELASKTIQLHVEKLKNKFSVLTKQGIRTKPSGQ